MCDARPLTSVVVKVDTSFDVFRNSDDRSVVMTKTVSLLGCDVFSIVVLTIDASVTLR